MRACFKRSYTTGEVARICGFKNARVVAKMFDNDEIGGELSHSKYGRHTIRKIPLKALIQFMQEHNIPLNRLDCCLDSLLRRTVDLKKTIERSGRIGVFSGFNGLSERLLDVIGNLDPLTSLNGVSEDKQRIANLRKLVEVMESHISVRHQIARASKK